MYFLVWLFLAVWQQQSNCSNLYMFICGIVPFKYVRPAKSDLSHVWNSSCETKCSHFKLCIGNFHSVEVTPDNLSLEAFFVVHAKIHIDPHPLFFYISFISCNTTLLWYYYWVFLIQKTRFYVVYSHARTEPESGIGPIMVSDRFIVVVCLQEFG